MLQLRSLVLGGHFFISLKSTTVTFKHTLLFGVAVVAVHVESVELSGVGGAEELHQSEQCEGYGPEVFLREVVQVMRRHGEGISALH